jgi:hypothetical protein
VIQVAITDKYRNLIEGTREAFETSNPFLCVHPTEYESGMFFPTVAQSWAVTHVPSGACALGQLPSKETALAVAEWLSPQLDWSGDFAAVSAAAPAELRKTIKLLNVQSDRYIDSIIEIMSIIGKLPAEKMVDL